MPTSSSAPARSRHRLTDEQIRQFDERGYLILRDWIPQPLLSKLQDAGHRWIEQGLRAREDDPEYEDFVFAERPAGRTMFRVSYLHSKGDSASLELLGSPHVLAVAESLCGRNFVPTYESMVFKQKDDGAAIPWHQDAVHPRRWRIFNLDVYLDASKIGAGALRVIPGTQLEAQDICSWNDTYGWDAPGVVHVEMKPGDVLLHDVMVVHGSERTEGNALRRTIYYEFRAAEEILHDGPWDRDWIDRRMRLIPVAMRAFQRSYPDIAPYDWRPDPEFLPAPAGSDADELRIAHVVHMNGTYCSAGDAGRTPRLDQPHD